MGRASEWRWPRADGRVGADTTYSCGCARRRANGKIRTGSMAIKVSIIEDDDWIRENLATQIRQTDGFECVGCYPSAEEAISELPGEAPDVVLMDINLPRMSGIECVRKLKTLMPSAQIMMLTVYEDSDKIFDSLLAGAN